MPNGGTDVDLALSMAHFMPLFGRGDTRVPAHHFVDAAMVQDMPRQRAFHKRDFSEVPAPYNDRLQALRNVVAVLRAAGAGPEHLVRLTWFVTDMDEYLISRKALGVAYREIVGQIFPAMSVIGVSALAEKRAKVEIEATAVVSE